MGLIEEGLVPILFFEGENTSRLEVIKDIPKGKAVYHFEKVDLLKAKEVLGDTVCFRGNAPVSLLCTGTPGEVKAYLKNLIDTFGRKGGLIVDSGAILDEAKPENVKAMVDFTKEYGGIAGTNE
jgi:uroporphyrinogen-III decarboxylase